LEKADGLKLDRDPRVVQQLEAARRDILARAYAEKVGEGAAKPSAEEIKKYYDDNPALFSQRRIYTLQELAVEARPEQYQMLRDRLGASKNINEFIEFLKAGGLRFAGNQAVRPAEQLPLNALKALAQLKDGQAIVNTTPNGLQVLVLAGSTTQPVSEEQARPAIEAFLLNERRARLLQDDLKALRAAARIEYVGKFAEGPHPGASAPAADAPGAAAQPAAPAAPAASSGLTDTDITKGMGLKK
ncbi:MAG: EpsD family peptidyl-prolyl cis-trans isomerase, partial [Rubrivivax sp.]|nr:EpsD family peptidyl-prolyl cis-trans isomerase [Rubrivivax sp.]